jgi:hypothetical protein
MYIDSLTVLQYCFHNLPHPTIFILILFFETIVKRESLTESKFFIPSYEWVPSKQDKKELASDLSSIKFTAFIHKFKSV